MKIKVLKDCAWAIKYNKPILYFKKNELREVDEDLACQMINNKDAIEFKEENIAHKKLDINLKNKMVDRSKILNK